MKEQAAVWFANRPRLYRKRPVTVEALQYTGQNGSELRAWLHEGGATYSTEGWPLAILTLEGQLEVSPGDFVIRGVRGEFYPCKPDIFEATYEAVS